MRDYSDEDDYYTQDFERTGVVSIWLEIRPPDADTDMETDTLQDLCGVGYYRLDQQDRYYFDGKFSKLPQLLEKLSYSASFADTVVDAAKRKGIQQAVGIVAQYDFAYDPRRVSRPVAEDPVFLGVFGYAVA